MKRLAIILLLLTLLCVGCAPEENDPAEATYTLGRWAGATNAKITATCQGIPLLGRVTLVYEIDGHVHRVGETLFSDNIYIEMLEDGSQALYTKDGGAWKRDVLRIAAQERVPAFIREDRLRPIFDTTLYEPIPDRAGWYHLREGVELTDISALTLQLGADFCRYTMQVNVDGKKLELTLHITEIGAVTLALPQTS